MTPNERKETDGNEKDLPLFNRVDPPEVGTTDGEDGCGGEQHPQGDIERAAELLRGEVPEGEPPRRPRRTEGARKALEERTCAVKDTAEGTDFCTCGHIRAIHHSGHQRTGCNSCYCPSFTKDALTVYDERAAANAEGNQPNGTFRVAKNQTCAICGESKPHVCRRTP